MALQINNLTGEIDVSASAPGKYIITRTVTNSNGSLSSTATDTVTIDPADNAAFSYSGSPFDIANATNPTPTVTGLSGGTFISNRNGFTFDATSSYNGDYIDANINPSTLVGNSNAYTVSAWVYPTGNGYHNQYRQEILGAMGWYTGRFNFYLKSPGGSGNVLAPGYEYGNAVNGNLYNNVSGTTILDNNVTILKNQWSHIAWTFDGNTTHTIYINGSSAVEITNGSAQGLINNVDIYIGSQNFNNTTLYNRLSGQISNIAIWNSDQSTNMPNIYNSGSPQTSYTSTPVLWYKTDNSSTFTSNTWTIPNAANPGTYNGTSDNLPLSALSTIDVNSTTGLISLSTSTVGTYPIVYDTTGATGSLCPATDTQNVQLVNTNFDYPSSVCNAAESPDVVPTNFIQQTGGQFTISPSSGMTINATNGTISTAGSTAATYAITYTIGSNSTTRNVTSTNILTPTTVSNLQTLTLNATNNYIDAGNDSSIQIFTGSHSYSFWVKKPVVSEAYIVGYGIDSVVIFNGDGRIRFYTGGLATADLYSTNSLSANTWHHVVCTYDTNGDKKIYIDGVEENDISTSGSISTNGLRLTIGAKYVGSYSHFFIGNIDEIAIWNKVLTSCDAAGIFEASAHQVTADLSTVYPNNLKYYNRMGD
jgi:hypothetical protein